MAIWVNTLVQNEERHLWYAVSSVIDHVDKVLLWDTGSTDKTLKIINDLQKKWPQKIDFKEVGNVSIDKFTEVRNQMLGETRADWVMILDGDEVWWDGSISEACEVINKDGDKYDSIVGEYINLVGDVYHHQDKNAGRYSVKGRNGFVTMRFMNKKRIKGLTVSKPHGQQGFFDAKGVLVQDRKEDDMYFLEKSSFMHFTNLPRSSSRQEDLKVPKRGFKLKHELGHKFPLDYYYPEALFKPRPLIVDSVWRTMEKSFYVNSMVQTPLRKIKRKLVTGKSGY